MKTFRNLTLSVALATAAAAMAAPDAPQILIPGYNGAGVIHGLSNNGLYGVASINPGSTGFSYTVGAVFYDLTGDQPVATDLAAKHSASGANDVTDDGKTVVGSVDGFPAVCRLTDDGWKWEYLPVPEMEVTMRMEDMYTGEISYQTFKLNGGEVNAVTPDGKYAVGLARSNEYIMLEQAVMWDLQKMEIVEVDSPVTNLFDEDEHQTRYMQLSDDGRYLLCWNSFSYKGGVIFVYDREKHETIYIDIEETPRGFEPRLKDYHGIELDGISKSLTSDGRYVTGGISGANDQTYVFRFDVFNKELKVYDDGIHNDANGWSVTKDGITLGATPSSTPYADALVCSDEFLYPVASLFSEVYGVNLGRYGIDNTGKPTLVSDDGKTVVFVTEPTKTYVARFPESLSEAVKKVNLMSNWSVYPSNGTRMTKMQNVTLTFDNPVETDPARASEIKLLGPDGSVVATPLANGGLEARDMKLHITFKPLLLEEGATYTLTVPSGICWVKGHTSSTNQKIEVKYVGRANQPVAVTRITPASGVSLSSLDLNDNPVQVTFDAPVMINGTADDRPVAQLYIDGGEEPAAWLAMDVDLYTNNLVIYPNTTYYLYKGSNYTVKVPAGAVTDLSGMGPSEAFEVEYAGSYVPQLGDERYIFRDACDDYANFLFFEGDMGEPVEEYVNMGFTQRETPWVVVRDDNLSQDMAFGSHSCYADGRASNDWVTTRQLRLPDDIPVVLHFQSQSYLKNKTDRLKVYVYENAATYNQLTSSTIADILKNGDLVYNEVQDPGKNEGIMAGEWRDNSISLEDYMGKSVYICFLNDNQNQSMVMIDNIEVVREVKSFVTVTTPENVIDMQSVTVRGIVSVVNETADYDTLSMRLLDGEGTEVSAINESGLGLKAGDTYKFEFPKALSLTVGEENPYTIECVLDGDEVIYEGLVRDLSFQPEKRVVIEEMTGRDCQYCPLGIAAMERLESLYGSKLIPVVLHAYNGSDPKGANIMSYASTVFMGDGSAPNGRINRRPKLSAPMAQDDKGKYHMTVSETGGGSNLWQDEVVDEFNEPAYLDIAVKAVPADAGYVGYEATVKSALNLNDRSIRVLGMLLEDHLLDRQVNGIFNVSDPLVGEFGQGGAYGMASFYYYFNNVARGYWGQSTNGTARLLPTDMKSGQEYKVSIEYQIPGIVDDLSNTKMVVMLIDESTGRVINANIASTDVSGVEGIAGDGALSIGRNGSEIIVSAPGDVAVEVYGLDGSMIKSASGNGSVSFGLDGYRGMVIVRAASGNATETAKIMM